MKPCSEFEILLIERAAGELGEADRAAVERHVAECPGCQAEARALGEVLRTVALPPRSAEERTAVASLSRRTLDAWRRRQRLGSLLQGAAAGLVAGAAAATLLFLLPTRAAAPGAVSRSRTDPAVIALERWASPPPMASELREGALEGLEVDLGEEGELLE